MDLSILITSYNNAQYVKEVIERVRINFPEATIIAIDDASTDRSQFILFPMTLKDKRLWALSNILNRGYGFTLRKAAYLTKSKYIAFQDSDLEYDPADIKRLYNVAKSGKEYSDLYLYGSNTPSHLIPSYKRECDYVWYKEKTIIVAYGRRSYYKVKSPISFIGRQIVNGLFCILFGFKIRDVCTAYKVMPRQLLLDMDTQSNGFEFGIELTAKLLRSGYKIVEIPVSYHPRSVAEGKSIRWSDGVRMIKEMIKWRLK